MEIIVNRFISDSDTTISSVNIDKQRFCFGLEDEYREVKVAGETRIPAGKYQVGVRTIGGFHNRYKKRFSGIHKGMLHIMDVPGFEYILVHCGNTDAHTAGCLLVGEGVTISLEKMTVTRSVAAYCQFYVKVIDAAIMGRLNITFQDNDRRFI